MKNKLIQKRKYKTVVLILLLLCLSAFVSNAMDEVYFSANVSSERNKLSYTVSVSEKSDVSALSMLFRYDDSQVELVDVRVGDALKSTMCETNKERLGEVILSCITTNPLQNEGDCITLEFKVLDKETDQLDINYSVTECINKDFDAIPYKQDEVLIMNPLKKSTDRSVDTQIASSSTKEQPVIVSTTDPADSASDIHSSNSSKSSDTSTGMHTNRNVTGKNETTKMTAVSNQMNPIEFNSTAIQKDIEKEPTTDAADSTQIPGASSENPSSTEGSDNNQDTLLTNQGEGSRLKSGEGRHLFVWVIIPVIALTGLGLFIVLRRKKH